MATSGLSKWLREREQRNKEMGARYLRATASRAAYDLINRTNKWETDIDSVLKANNDRYANGNDTWRSDANDYFTKTSERVKALDTEMDSINSMLKMYGDYWNDDFKKSIYSSLSQNPERYHSALNNAAQDRDYWGQWKSEDEYNQALEALKIGESYAAYDSAAGAKKIATLRDYAERSKAIDQAIYELQKQLANPLTAKRRESINNEISGLKKQKLTLSNEYNEIYGNGSSNADHSLPGAGNKSEQNDYLDRVGSMFDRVQNPVVTNIVDFDKLLTEAEQFDTLAKRYQNAQKLSGVGNERSEYYDPNFSTLSQYIPQDVNDTKSARHLFINDSAGYNDLISRLNKKIENGTASPEDIDIAQNIYVDNEILKHLSQNERALYNYYYNTGGVDAADSYLEAIAESLNYERGKEIYSQIGDRPILQRLYGFASGLDNFASGMQSLVSDEYIPPSATQYAGQMISEDLGDNGLKWYNAKDKQWEPIKIMDKTTAQLAYDLNNTMGNMLPSILTGVLVELALPSVGEGALVTAATASKIGSAAGASLMGLSAGGNAKNEMLELGYSKKAANNYAVLVGASEAGLSYLIGSIPGVSAGGIFSTIAEKAFKGIDNAFSKVAILLADGADEALEEGIQTGLESWFKEIATGVDFEDPNLDEVLYSSLLGFLSSAGMGGGKIVVDSAIKTANTINTGKTLKQEYGAEGIDSLVNKGLEYNGTAAYKTAEKMAGKLGKEKKVSNYSVGKLAMNLGESAIQSSFTKAVESRDSGVALTKLVMGKEMSKSDVIKILGNEKALTALNEMLGTNITKDADVKAVREEVKRSVERQTDTVIESLGESLREPVKALVKGEIVSDKKIAEVIADEKARAVLSLRTGVDITDKSTAREVKEAVTEAANDHTRGKTALVYAAALNIGENGAKGVVNIIDNGSGDVATTVQAFNAVYQAGKQGKAITEAKNPHLNELTFAEKKLAYEYGVMDALLDKEQTAEVDSSVEAAVAPSVEAAVAPTNIEVSENAEISPTEAVEVKAEASEPTALPKGSVKLSTGEVVTPVETLTKEHTRVVEGGKAIGMEVVIADIKSKTGKTVDAMFDGKRLYINPKPTSGSPAFVLLKHEMTHFPERRTPKSFATFSTEVTDSAVFREWLKKKGYKSSQAYIQEIISNYKTAGKSLTNPKAHGEMVANFVADTLFADDDGFDRFVSELTPKQKKSLGDYVRDFIDWIKEKLGKMDEIEMLEKRYAKLVGKAQKGFESKSFVEETKSTAYNYQYVEDHKVKLKDRYTDNAAVALKTLQDRYDKIIELWEKLGGQLDSKFLNDWNSKVGKDRAFTVFKAQSGYKYNVELSSMCKKGVPLFEAIDTIVKQEVMKELKVDTLGKAEKEILYDILKSDGFDIPCAICYVEQARQREGAIIDAFLNGNSEGKVGWNSILHEVEGRMKNAGVDFKFPALDRTVATDKYVPARLNMTEAEQRAFYEALRDIANREIDKYNEENNKNRPRVTSLTPQAIAATFKGNISSDLKIFKVLFQNPDSRFTIESDLLYASTTTHNLAYAHHDLYSLFNQQGGVSGYKTKQGNVVYWGDILDKKWEASKLRKEGGIRYQSNSDSQMYTLLDQVQMFVDLTAKGYYLQSYSKVLSYLKLLGLSKGKINASLIPSVVVYRNADGTVDWARTQENAGLDEDGNPIYDDVEGINHKEAFMLIEDAEYSKSIGGVCIGYSDNHIIKLLDDPRVQLIIGFHDKTNNPDKRYRGARYAKNYNGINEAVDSNGKTVHIGFNQFVQQAEKMFKKDGENFVGTANHNGKVYSANDIPRLAAQLYLEYCAEKKYAPAYNIEGVVDHPNYYKLLADFSLYDSKGQYAPHQKVEYNMPDQVPYLDGRGVKRYMSTEYYIRTELQKELKVRDDIAEKLADKSEDGIIPKFIKAVNERNASVETSYSFTPDENGVDTYTEEQYNLYTATDEFIRDVPHNLRHDFARSLANKTSDMADGEVRTIYVSGYIFEADGYMHGHIIAPYNETTKKLLKERRAEYGRINENTEIASVWSETIRNAERGSVSNIDVPQRGRPSSDDRLFSTPSERNASRDNERIRSTYETKEEVDAIVQKLKDVYGLNEESNYSYTPDKEANVDELIAQYKDGRLTEEQFRDALVNKKQKTDPISLANTTAEDFNTTPDVKRKTGENNGDGERDTIIARGASKLFSEEFKEEAKADAFIMRYKTIKNKDALRKAAQELDEGGEAGVLEWFRKPVERGVSLNDVVKGYILLEKYKLDGDLEGQVAVAQKLSEMGTMGGQVVQSFTILSRFTPEGMLLYAQRVLDDVRKRMIKTQSDAWLKKHADALNLTDEDIEFIYNRTILASEMMEGRDKQVMLAEIAARLLHKIPPAKGQSIKSLQRISMLLNPKTIIRNVLGNATITPVHWLSDLIHAPVDMALSKISHKRVKGLRSDVKASMEASWNGMKYALEDWLKDINTQENLDRFEINKNGGRSFYEGGRLSGAAKALNAMDRLTSFTLAVGDRPFYEYWFSRSLTSQMAANKFTTPTAEMIEIATQEALERTWQDENNVTAMVTKTKGALNTLSIAGYGLGDVFIKFTKTPANLAKAIYDFSPAGFATAARDAVRFSRAVKSGKDVAKAQRNFGKSFSNAAAGTLLYVMAYALFKAGKLSGGSDEDKDVAAFEKWVQGIPAYSVNLFGKWFSYEWMQPIGSVAAIVSDYMDAKDTEGDDKLQPIITALKSGGAVLYNQSFLKSFQTLFTADNIVDGFFEALLDDPSAFVPQIFSQIANVADENRRTTFDKTSPIKSAINAIAYKIPGLRNTLTEDVDVFGRVVPNSQNNVFDAFFNPANTYTNTSDAVTNHVYDLYKTLGNKGMIPAKAPYSIEINGKKYAFSSEERARYQTVLGTVSYKIIEGLLGNEIYNSYSPAEQEVVIKAVYEYANKVALASFEDVEIDYDLLKKYNSYLTKTKYESMSDEEKKDAYYKGMLNDYTDILDTDENGVIAYFTNKGARTAIQKALYAGDGAAARGILDKATEAISKYSDDEDAVKSFTTSIRTGVTSAMKEEYIVAYYEGDSAKMEQIKQMLIELGIYGKSSDVKKTLKAWLEGK